jgi:hypothetical protein
MERVLRSRRLADFIAAVQADGERATYWAERCGWVPASGYCPRSGRPDCREQCFFRWMRDEELAAVRQARLRRRLRQTYSLALVAIDVVWAYCFDLLLAA